jgi:membrane-associated phospholipid phosphatase
MLLLLCSAHPARAQEDGQRIPGIGDGARAFVHDVGALPSVENGIWAGIGAAAALALHPLDDDATIQLQKTQEGTLHKIFLPGKFIGETGVQVGMAAATYLYGRATNRPQVATAGMELVRAELLTEGLVQGLKFAVRRQRPDGSDNRSFPSGHAAITFATATVLQRRFGWVRAMPAYLVASYVAAARVTEDKHFLSDVVGGAFVGTIAGRTVTRDGNGQRVSFAPVFGAHETAFVFVFRP